MVTAPQSVNATVDIIRDYFNAYLMHKIYVEHLVQLGLPDLLRNGWVEPSNALDVYNNLTKFLASLNYNVKKLAQLVSSIQCFFAFLCYCCYIAVE